MRDTGFQFARYMTPHKTQVETDKAREEKQNIGDPCYGGTSITAWDGAEPPASRRGTCDTCDAIMDMALFHRPTIAFEP